MPGTIVLEALLWCCILLPGIIYSGQRRTKAYYGCPRCRSPHMIPPDTPIGSELLPKRSEPEPFRIDPVRAAVAAMVLLFLILMFVVGKSPDPQPPSTEVQGQKVDVVPPGKPVSKGRKRGPTAQTEASRRSAEESFARRLQEQLENEESDITAYESPEDELTLKSEIFDNETGRSEFLKHVTRTQTRQMCTAGFRQVRLAGDNFLIHPGVSYALDCK